MGTMVTVVDDDYNDDDDIYNDAVYVCNEKSSLPPGSLL